MLIGLGKDEVIFIEKKVFLYFAAAKDKLPSSLVKVNVLQIQSDMFHYLIFLVDPSCKKEPPVSLMSVFIHQNKVHFQSFLLASWHSDFNTISWVH
jgi:hypothetical protein